jgi:hypothetical protein
MRSRASQPAVWPCNALYQSALLFLPRLCFSSHSFTQHRHVSRSITFLVGAHRDVAQIDGAGDTFIRELSGIQVAPIGGWRDI